MRYPPPSAAVLVLGLTPLLAALGTGRGVSNTTDPARAFLERASRGEPVAELLEDVDEIAAPGIPGGVCAFGPEAFVLVTGTNGVPVVAGAEAGEGRVLIFGHGGYLGRESFETADTGRLFKNALRWCSGGKRKPRVVCPGGAELAEALRELGVRADATQELRGADCVIFSGQDVLSRRRLAELRAFVADGGGLIAAATGWGWQQLTTNQMLARDLPGNRLLVPFGVGFSLETTSKTGELGLVTNPRPSPLAHAARALTALRGGALDPADEALAEKRLAAALACLPDHEPRLLVPLREWLESEARSRAGSDETTDTAVEHLIEASAKRTWRPLGERWGEWYAIGPFNHPKGGREVASPQAPERSLEQLVAGGSGPDLEATFRGKGGRVSWSPLELSTDGRELDVGEVRLDRVLTAPEKVDQWTHKSVAYLYRSLELSADTTLSLLVGSDDGLRLWCNGVLVADRPTSSGVQLDEAPVALALEAGVNHLLAKVANGDGVWSFRLRRDEQGVDQAAINQAIDRGVKFLLERQQVDGSWPESEKYGAGYTAFATYTLLKCGLDREHPAVRRGMAFVRAREANHTYSLTCKILALAALGAERGELEEAVEELLQWQEHNGLWAYPIYPHGPRLPEDLSNTIFVSLALRAAAGRGVEIPLEVWEDMLQGALLCWSRSGTTSGDKQRGHRGFSYRVGEKATGSMTTAGLSVLVMGREALGDEIERKLARQVEEALADGRGWLDEHMAWDRNPGHTRWHYYFLYGLERLGSLLDVEVLGKVTWYPSGAEYLVRAQGPEGGWKSQETAPQELQDTLLALLFLNRATAPRTGEKEVVRDLYTAEGPDADVGLRAQGENPFTVWITGYGPRVRAELGWPGSASRAPRIERVRYVAVPKGGGDEILLGEVVAEADSDSTLERFEARLTLPPGSFSLFARLDALKPPAEQGLQPERVALESQKIEIQIPTPFAPEALHYAEHRAANLLLGRASIEASSHYGEQTAAMGADGTHGTRWHSDIADEAPWWRASLSNAVDADRLHLSHAWPRETHHDAPQPAKVEVILNDEQRFEVTMDPEPLAKTTLELGATVRVVRIELRILESRNRVLGRDAVGFSEIELVGP